MTISSSNNKINYVPDGVQLVFAYNFRVDNAADMLVYLDDVLVTTGWTIDGLGDSQGGNVTFSVAPVGNVLTLLREVPYTQETDYTAYDPFPAETHEAALDDLTMQTQQLNEKQQRTLRAPPSDDGTVNYEMPPYAASNAIGWSNEDPKALANISLIDLIGADAAMIRYIAAGPGAVITNVQNKLRESVSIADFGASPYMDNTNALQLAVASGASHITIPNTGLPYQFTTWALGTGQDDRAGLLIEALMPSMSGDVTSVLECTSLTETAIDIRDGGIEFKNVRVSATAARKASATFATGVHVRGDLTNGTLSGIKLTGLWVQNQPGHGIVAEAMERGQIEFCDSNSNMGRGFYIKAVGSFPVGIANTLIGCRSFGNALEGWAVESWFNTFIGCQSILNNQSPSLYGSTSQEVYMDPASAGNIWINPDVEAQDQASGTPGVDRPLYMLGFGVHGGDQQIIGGIIAGFDTGVLLGADAPNATVSNPRMNNAGVGYDMEYGVDNSAVDDANITMRGSAALAVAIRNKVFTGQSGSRQYTPQGLLITGDPDVVAGSGAISTSMAITHLQNSGSPDNLTLASPSFDGVFKYIFRVSGGSDSIITPTSMSNGTSITLSAIGDNAVLFFTNSSWSWISGTVPPTP